MPRKRRSKKDPVIQKLSFDEEPEEATNTGDSRESKLISKSGTDSQSLGGVWSPEADALPTASEQPGYAELIPTDFAHRDRLRFSQPDGLTDNNESPNRFLVTCICLIGLILLVQWIKSEGYNLFLRWYLDLWINVKYDDKDSESSAATFFGLSLFGFIWSLLVSLLLGLSCLFFSWGITYQDSLQPGQFPPSPVSPNKYRKQSGHTFHSSYVMALVNGIAVFALSAWWLYT